MEFGDSVPLRIELWYAIEANQISFNICYIILPKMYKNGHIFKSCYFDRKSKDSIRSVIFQEYYEYSFQKWIILYIGLHMLYNILAR